MRHFTLLLIAIFAGSAAVPPARCADKSDKRTFHLQWRDLERATRVHLVALELPSGIKLRGDVMAVESDELVLDVCKTSNKRAYPQGRSIIPRPEVTRLKVIKTRHMWRAVGGAIGGGIGTMVAIPVAQVAGRDSAVQAAALAIAIPTALGYALGWAADINEVEIVVEPDR